MLWANWNRNAHTHTYNEQYVWSALDSTMKNKREREKKVFWMCATHTHGFQFTSHFCLFLLIKSFLFVLFSMVSAAPNVSLYHQITLIQSASKRQCYKNWKDIDEREIDVQKLSKEFVWQTFPSAESSISDLQWFNFLAREKEREPISRQKKLVNSKQLPLNLYQTHERDKEKNSISFFCFTSHQKFNCGAGSITCPYPYAATNFHLN